MKLTKYSIPLLLFVLLNWSCEKESYVEPIGLLDGYSFEEEPLGFFSWSDFNDEYTKDWTEEEAYDGVGSLRIQSSTTGNNTFAYWALSYYDFEIGKPLKVRIRAKVEDMEGSGGILVNMFARNENGSGNFAVGTQDALQIEEGEWVEMEQEISTPLTNVVDRVDIYFFLSAGVKGTVYWDKLEIYTD